MNNNNTVTGATVAVEGATVAVEGAAVAGPVDEVEVALDAELMVIDV